MANLVIVKIVGEPWLSRAKEYQAQLIAFRQSCRDFALSVGAVDAPNGFPGSPPAGLIFTKINPPPKDWTKPTKHGFSAPKKGSPAAQALAALPVKPSTGFIFGDAVIGNLSYDMPCGGWGSGGIAMMIETVSVGWIGDVFVARMPHAGRAAAEHLARHPDHTIRYGAAEWQLPDGVVEISQAELDLLDAQHRVLAEKAEAA